MARAPSTTWSPCNATTRPRLPRPRTGCPGRTGKLRLVWARELRNILRRTRLRRSPGAPTNDPEIQAPLPEGHDVLKESKAGVIVLDRETRTIHLWVPDDLLSSEIVVIILR